MAYFPNGSSAEVFDRQCDTCVLGDDQSCPIALVQLLHNYDQVGNDLARGILLSLVSDDGICATRALLEEKSKDAKQRG